MEQSAIYYEHKYYLLPIKAQNFDLFIGSITDGQSVDLEMLMQENCIAPYFIKSKTVQTSVIIYDKRLVYPTKVHILNKESYEARLDKIVTDYCACCLNSQVKCSYGTLNYSNKITLDMICHDRESSKSELECREVLDYFWWNIYNSDIENLIKLNDSRRIYNIVFNELIAFLPSTYLFVEIKNSKVYIYISAANSLLNFFILRKLNQVMLERLKSYVVFSPFLPRESYDYKTYSGYDAVIMQQHINVLRFKLLTDNGKTILNMSLDRTIESGYEHKLLQFVYLHLCYEIGEDRLLSYVDEFFVSIEPLEDFIYESSLKLKIDRFIAKKYSGTNQIIPSVTFQLCGELPYKNDINIINASLPDLSIAMELNYDYIISLNKDYAISVGYIVFNTNGCAVESGNQEFIDTTLSYVLEKLKQNGNGGTTAIHFGDNHICIDMLVVHRKKFLRDLRDLAPIFIKHNAKWVECKEGGLEIYELNFAPKFVDKINILT